MAQTESSGTETPNESAQRNITVAVVDDHESVRLGLKAAFIDEGYDFVLAAATVKELVEGLNGREVDVVVLDLSLGDGSTVTDNVKNVQATGSAVLVHSLADRDFSKAQLGRREREILDLYASGLPLKLAAQQLGIGYSTAREYLDRIRVKYVEVGRPAPTKVDLLRRAVEDGILPGLDSEGGDGH